MSYIIIFYSAAHMFLIRQIPMDNCEELTFVLGSQPSRPTVHGGEEGEAANV